MKRLKSLIAILLLVLALTPWAKAEEPMVVGTLLDHVTTVTQFASGKTNLALLDSVVLIGSYKGQSILDLQAGFNGTAAPESAGMNLVAGGFFKVSSLLKDKMHLSPQWKFLNSLEHGVAYQYDFRNKRDYVVYQVGLAFTLNPKS